MFEEVFSMNEDEIIEELYCLGVDSQLIHDARLSGFAGSRLTLLRGLYIYVLVEGINEGDKFLEERNA